MQTEKRLHLSTRERVRLFNLHGGVCHICKQEIDGTREAWDIEHVLALGLGGEETDENRQPAHRDGACHKAKTKRDVAMMAKADRQRAKHIGAKAPSKHIVPGSKRSPWKKPLYGPAVRRDA